MTQASAQPCRLFGLRRLRAIRELPRSELPLRLFQTPAARHPRAPSRLEPNGARSISLDHVRERNMLASSNGRE
jgi:hypothetical protein